jgi:hypothetical protein
MPRSLETKGLWNSIKEGDHAPDRLRQLITFEDTKSIQGICRVMVRTHLNRTGIGRVSRKTDKTRGNTDKTLSPRVLGPFETAFNPKTLVAWPSLVDAWLDFAHTPEGQGLFDDCDLRSLEKLRDLPREALNDRGQCRDLNIHDNWRQLVRGVHSGLNYLARDEFDATLVWERVNKASQSVEGIDALISEFSQVEGYGRALAGSFLADLGGEQFVKTDTHVKAGVAAFLHLDKAKVFDRHAFLVIQNTAKELGITPRAVDKIMYLGGSGNWYLLGQRQENEFLQLLRRIGHR